MAQGIPCPVSISELDTRGGLSMSQALTSLNQQELRIIAMFRQKLDAKEIAKRLHFDDHRQMANYMKSRGYIWNSKKMNYEFEGEACSANHSKEASQPGHMANVELPNGDSVTDVMEYLKTHRDVLMELFGTHSIAPQMPRYVIPGIYTTKSVYMNHNFDLLARQFSEEKNISQRDIFEIALIEFFKKYGYHEKVQALFSSATLMIRLAAAFAICMIL